MKLGEIVFFRATPYSDVSRSFRAIDFTSLFESKALKGRDTSE
jgi:hypothetical protein